MVCGSSIKIPVVLRRLLKMDRLKLGRQSLLIPASGVEAGGRRAHRWIWGWDTPLTGPLTRRPIDEGVRGLGRPSRRRAGRTARPRPHMNGACPRVVIARPKAASSWALAARRIRSRGGGVASAAGPSAGNAASRSARLRRSMIVRRSGRLSKRVVMPDLVTTASCKSATGDGIVPGRHAMRGSIARRLALSPRG